MDCLLIDDDLDDQELFMLALRNIEPPVQCTLAKDGREGLEKINRDQGKTYDFIFIDLNMPRMNGVETLEEIKKISFLRRPKIIVCSTTSDQKIVDDALARGADDFLVKPSRLSELVDKIKHIFSGHTEK